MSLAIAVALACSAAWRPSAQSSAAGQSPAGAWHFVASGDARNCGDIVAPAIAETAAHRNAAFYWHLGDLRRSTGTDEDIAHQPAHLGTALTLADYQAMEWQDFIDSQIAPFGSRPYFIGIGNHEINGTKTREEFVTTFTPWLDAPALRAQRLKDTPSDTSVKAYYHWIDRGVAFYFLDNATNDQFAEAQLNWFQRLLTRDVADPAITTIVAGMHKPLPDGYNIDHSMNESPTSTATGRYVAGLLLQAQNGGHKRVYVLASHQHFYMEDAYDTPYWKDHGGVLPGWVVGTAGAVRYSLPMPSPKIAMTNVYGSLLGTVQPNGEIQFEFQEIHEPDVPATVVQRYGQEFVHWCFASNTQAR
jgi:hypothetical protein